MDILKFKGDQYDANNNNTYLTIYSSFHPYISFNFSPKQDLTLGFTDWKNFSL